MRGGGLGGWGWGGEARGLSAMFFPLCLLKIVYVCEIQNLNNI